MSKIQQEKILHLFNLSAIHLRFSSIPLIPVSCLGICSKVLFDRHDPTSHLSPHAVRLLPLPELASLYVCISDCCSIKGLLFIKKQNIILPNHDVSQIHEEKENSVSITFPLFFENR